MRRYALPIAAPTCDRCGTTAEDDVVLPLGWSAGSAGGGTTLLCPECTRVHTRDIEAKLDEDWWLE